MKKLIVSTLGLLVVLGLGLAMIPTTRDEFHWRWASYANSIEEFEQYIKLHADGKHVAEAKANIELLHLQNATVLSADGKLEGENGDLEEGGRWDNEGKYYWSGDASHPWRSDASGKKTVHLGKGGKLRWYFATRENKTYVISLRYSNDGGSDIIAIFLDSTRVGECTTEVVKGYSYYDYGMGWNSFKECPIGSVSLSPGSHVLILQVKQSDEYGVEVDYVKLEPSGRRR